MAKKPPRARAKTKRQTIYERDPHEWYVEEAYCVELLLRRYRFPGPIYDPCAGMGTIPRVAKRLGYKTIATDLVDRGFEGVTGGIDFLDAQRNIFADSARTIVSNFPFGGGKLVRAMLARALALPKLEFLAAVLPSKLLFGRKTWLLYQEKRPIAFHPIVPRPSMPPGKALVAGTVTPKGGKEDFFWAVWDLRTPCTDWPRTEVLMGAARGRSKAKPAREQKPAQLPLLTREVRR